VPDAVRGIDDLVADPSAKLARLGARRAGGHCAPQRGRTKKAGCGPGPRGA
jgi:hypothetical protein